MPGARRRRASQDEMNRLRRELKAVYGIRYTNRINSVRRLKAMMEDPYPHQLATFRRWWGIDSFDFRGKGITPKKGAYVKWVPKTRGERMTTRGVGRFVQHNNDGTSVVSYPVYLGFGYKNRNITIDTFQIVDYREDR
jgi:hypothetical protein